MGGRSIDGVDDADAGISPGGGGARDRAACVVGRAVEPAQGAHRARADAAAVAGAERAGAPMRRDDDRMPMWRATLGGAIAVAVAMLLMLRVSSPAPSQALEPRVIKIATIAPEGTLWAQETRATGGEIETLTGGALRVKFYNGGVAGDEIEVLSRIHKGQLDGTISAGILCEKLSPTLRAIRIPGMFESYEEAVQMAARLRPVTEAEIQAAGLVL